MSAVRLVSGTWMLVHLEDGRSLTVPLEWFPRLKAATPAPLRHYELIGHGLAIHWPDIDEDISVPRRERGV